MIKEKTAKDNVKMGGTSLKPVRQSNFELLRIIAMIMIIGAHFKVDFSNLSTNYEFNARLVSTFINTFGQVGVALFLLISGYFLCTSKFKIQSLIRLFFQVLFYSILSAVLIQYTELIFFTMIQCDNFRHPIKLYQS